MSETNRLTGRVQRIVEGKGYGFIRVVPLRAVAGEPFYEASSDDFVEYFMHRKGFGNPDLYDALREGDKVTFEPRSTAKGLRAVNIEKG